MTRSGQSHHAHILTNIMDTVRLTLALNIITSVLGNSININSLYHDNNDYVDIDEGALVKVEFSKTLRFVSGCKNLFIDCKIFSVA